MKKRISYIALMVFTIWLFAVSLHAAIYSWKDENGVKHFSNEPPANKNEPVAVSEEIQIDPEDIKRWQEEKEYRSRNKKKAIEQKSQKKKVAEKKYKTSKTVVIYSTDHCGYCKRAKAFFNQHNIRFTEYNIDKSTSAKREFKRLKGRGVPLIVIGGLVIHGFNEQRIIGAL